MSSEQKKVTTSSLLRGLFRTQNLQNFLMQNEKAMQIPTFCDYLTKLCRESGVLPEHIIKRASIDRTYGHQIFNGTRKPSRDKVIQLAFGFAMDVEETQKLLQVAEKSLLYPKIRRDAVILHCLAKQKDIFETQVALQNLGLTILGGEWQYGQ